MAIEDGVMKMRPVADGIEIGPGDRVEFKPGGLHFMLTGIDAALVAEDEIELTLEFEKAGWVRAAVSSSRAGDDQGAPPLSGTGAARAAFLPKGELPWADAPAPTTTSSGISRKKTSAMPNSLPSSRQDSLPDETERKDGAFDKDKRPGVSSAEQLGDLPPSRSAGANPDDAVDPVPDRTSDPRV